MSSTSRRVAGRPVIRDLVLALYPAALVLFTLAGLLWPQRQGPLALAQVFAHFLFLPALLLLPFALLQGVVLLRIALAAALASFLLVYPPALSLPLPTDEPAALTVLSWNVYVGGVEPAALRRAVSDHRPDVVALQEAILKDVAADPALAAAYPYRIVRSDETAPGLAILSKYPILESGVPASDDRAWDMPRVVWARLDVGGRTVTLVNAHPIPPRTSGRNCALLRCYNRGPRDAQIAGLRQVVDELSQRTGDPLVLAGDMNVTEREPAYLELAHDLHDAHRAAGLGFGLSWRPHAFNLPFGLIRIDYLFSDGQLRPTSFATDCSHLASDHCLLVGGFAFTGEPASTAGRQP